MFDLHPRVNYQCFFSYSVIIMPTCSIAIHFCFSILHTYLFLLLHFTSVKSANRVASKLSKSTGIVFHCYGSHTITMLGISRPGHDCNIGLCVLTFSLNSLPLFKPVIWQFQAPSFLYINYTFTPTCSIFLFCPIYHC